MNLKYKGRPHIKFKRVPPKRANLCKLSVYSNALNYLGYKQKFGYHLTPEKLLKMLNEKRAKRKFKIIDPDVDVVPNKDLNEFFDKCKIGKRINIKGKRGLNIELWKKLIREKILLAPDHQMLYSYPTTERSFEFAPVNFLNKLVKDKKFSYESFIRFYKHVLKSNGPIDEGHVDLAVDIINQKGEDYVVLANLNSYDNKHYLKVPFHFFMNYLGIDWVRNKKIENLKEFPNKKSLHRLRKTGSLPRSKFGFGYGWVEIFYKKEEEQKVRRILNEHR